MDARIVTGLELLLKEDQYLLANKVGERAITHKLGEHYQKLFNEWNVDCEFNRNLENEKTININVPKLLILMRKFLEENTNNIFSVLEKSDVSKEDIDLILSQLKDPNIEYDQEREIIYHILTLRDGNKLKKRISPDIIIHHRGTKDNYIVIEAKRSLNNNSVDRAYDIIKLATLVDSSEYKYKQGIFIDIPVEHDLLKHKKFTNKNYLHKRVFKVFSK